jgi:hypothetical protein
MKKSGIKPATFRLVTQCLNQLRQLESYPFKDEAQTALLKSPVRTAL